MPYQQKSYNAIAQLTQGGKYQEPPALAFLPQHQCDGKHQSLGKSRSTATPELCLVGLQC